jgi:HSP20 family protein
MVRFNGWLPGSRTNDPFSDDQPGSGIRAVNHPVKQLNVTERKQPVLMRFDPFRELESVAQLLGRQSGNRQMAMPMDAYRQGDQFIVHFDMPGMDPDSIDLTVEKNVLTVRAERSWQASDDTEVVVSERPQGTFTRQLFLGEGLDPERIEATYNNGVLTVVIPVAEQAKPRKVSIARAQSGGGGNGHTITASASEGQAADTSA